MAIIYCLTTYKRYLADIMETSQEQKLSLSEIHFQEVNERTKKRRKEDNERVIDQQRLRKT